MKVLFLFIVILALYSSAETLRVHNKKVFKNNLKDIPPFKTYYLDQFLDHFNTLDTRSFKQRYLVNGIIFVLYFFLISYINKVIFQSI